MKYTIIIIMVYIIQETPFARVNKDTHVIASTNAAAAELLQRVHRIAATGTFDPSDKR